MPTTKDRGLGKGFDVLLPKDFDSSLLVDANDRVQKIGLELIKPNPDQPRREFEETALSQLAGSIREHGVLQPIIVTPDGDEYIIVAGERRWRAAKKAGLKTIPAISRSHKELERLEIALVENVQRVDLSPLEQAVSISRLLDQFGMSIHQIARRLGKADSTVNNLSRLVQLPENAKQALRDKKIVEGHARQILAIKDNPEKQNELLELTVKRGWSVRQAERFVTAYKEASPDVGAKELQAKVDTETAETKQLGKKLKTKVTIRRMAHGGKIEVGFNSDKDLERLINYFLNLS